MEELLSNIDEKIAYIKSNTDNAFILKECMIIDIKLEDFRDRKYESKDIINDICDKIINYDIRNMIHTVGISDNLKNIMEELSVLVEKIKTVYFE